MPPSITRHRCQFSDDHSSNSGFTRTIGAHDGNAAPASGWFLDCCWKKGVQQHLLWNFYICLGLYITWTWKVQLYNYIPSGLVWPPQTNQLIPNPSWENTPQWLPSPRAHCSRDRWIRHPATQSVLPLANIPPSQPSRLQKQETLPFGTNTFQRSGPWKQQLHLLCFAVPLQCF